MAEKYISIASAKKLFCDACDSEAICPRENGYDCPSLKDFDELSVADVVEVVRCMDCKYLAIGTVCQTCAKGILSMIYPSDYCSRGRRRTK